jgi:hypothetical protein
MGNTPQQDHVRMDVTIRGSYHATPGNEAYDGSSDPHEMAAIDAELSPDEILGHLDGVQLTIKPAPPSKQLDRLRRQTLGALISSATRWVSSYAYFETADRNPGATDDAEMEMNDEMLLRAAREFVDIRVGEDDGPAFGGSTSVKVAQAPEPSAPLPNGVARFRKRPVEIEARRLPGDELYADAQQVAADQVAAWCGGEVPEWDIDQSAPVDIKTLEGTMRASPGDWVIKGVNGEFYPCKPDVFEKTYEPMLAEALRAYWVGTEGEPASEVLASSAAEAAAGASAAEFMARAIVWELHDQLIPHTWSHASNNNRADLVNAGRRVIDRFFGTDDFEVVSLVQGGIHARLVARRRERDEAQADVQRLRGLVERLAAIAPEGVDDAAVGEANALIAAAPTGEATS